MSKFVIPDIKKKIFSTTLEVRISDINYGNHLGHDHLISLLHEARVRFFKKHGYCESGIHGLGILITSLSIRYFAEVYYSEKIIISIGVDNIKKTSVDLLYVVTSETKDKTIANALTTLTFYDYQNKKIGRVPASFLTILA